MSNNHSFFRYVFMYEYMFRWLVLLKQWLVTYLDLNIYLHILFKSNLPMFCDFIFPSLYLCYWLSGTVDWACTTKADKLGSIPSLVTSKTRKMVLVACPTSGLVLMGRCKETVYVQCCHWFAISAAFTAKASGDGCCKLLVTLQKGYKTKYEETEISCVHIFRLQLHTSIAFAQTRRPLTLVK